MSYTTIPIQTIAHVPNIASTTITTGVAATATAVAASKSGPNWLLIAMVAILLLGGGYLIYKSSQSDNEQE